jgi:hypothetical protein
MIHKSCSKADKHRRAGQAAVVQDAVPYPSLLLAHLKG